MSVELIDQMGSDLSVVNAARVSFHKFHEEFQEGDVKLINYLAKHNHWSPFAHNSLQFRIKAPIFVARQLVKHQVGGVWNEVSRRYVDDEPEYFLPSTWRSRPENGMKQGSGANTVELTFNYAEASTIASHNAYCNLLEKGVAPEQARMILPQNTMTEWIWTGSLMFFARMCKQRLDGHAQQETREIAEKIQAAIPEEFQHSWKALMT